MPETEIITFGCRLNAFESEVIRRAAAAAGLAGAVIVNTCAVTAEAERQARQAIRRARRRYPEATIIVTGCAAELAPARYAALPEVDRVLGNQAKLHPQSYLPAPQPTPGTPARAGGGPGAPSHAAGLSGENWTVVRAANFGSESPLPGLVPGIHVSSQPASPRQRRGWPDQVRPRGLSLVAQDPGLATASASPDSPARAGEGREGGVDGFEGKSRAFLQVQQGCDHRCTFCIIPYARGASRSVPMGLVAEQARRLVASGYREIVLTGVDLTAYGADLPGAPRLGQMVRRLLAAVPEIERLRLSSLDPAEIDAELWRLLAEERRLMPHLHLSLQAGDDLILKRMKRRHSRAEAIAVAARAQALRPEVALGADLIAGFPTETEDAFRRSLDLVVECGLAFVHVFPYSPRPGTPAARMPQLPTPLVKERAARLRSAGQAALAAELASRIGSETNVLVEQDGMGRAEFYARVHFAVAGVAGSIKRMRLVDSTGGNLVGVQIA